MDRLASDPEYSRANGSGIDERGSAAPEQGRDDVHGSDVLSFRNRCTSRGCIDGHGPDLAGRNDLNPTDSRDLNILAKLVRRFGGAESLQLQVLVPLTGTAGLVALLLSNPFRQRLWRYANVHQG